MPILESIQPEATDAPLGRIPQPAAQPEEAAPSFGEYAKAALTAEYRPYRQAFLGSEVDPAAQPGFNFLDYIPPGFLHDYGDRYVHAENPAQAQEVTNRIRGELATNDVIARSGWRGSATAFAAGLTDPVNIAAMTLMPEAAPTRLGNAVRWAFTNAVVTGAQETLRQAGTETATPGEAMFNIGAGAVLGGILGPLARRVPRGTLDKLATDLGEELHGAAREAPGPSNVLGPTQRSVFDELDSHVAGLEEAGFKDGYIEPAGPAANEARVAEPPEAEPAPAIQRPLPERLAQDADLRADLTGMKSETGWAQEGGRLLRNEAGEVSGRTSWIPNAEWWPGRPGGYNADEVGRIVDKALAGGQLGPKQRQLVEYMADVSRERRANEPYLPSETELSVAGAEHSVDNANEVALTARAAEIDPDRVESLAKQHEDDDVGFLKAIKNLLDEHTATAERGEGGQRAPRPTAGGGPDLGRAELAAAGAARTGPAELAAREAAAGHPAERAALVEQPLPGAEHALPGEPMYVNPGMESTAGAMAVHGGALADMDVARGGKLYSKTVGRPSIAARLMQSESPSVRRLTMELMNLPGTLEGHYKDIASPNPIERILWNEVDARQTSAISKMNEHFSAYKQRVRKEGGVALNRTEFEDQWARAMRRGDKSQIPEVADMARWQRENIINPYWERAKAADLAPKEAQLFADSYLTRLYDIPTIRKNKGAWLDLLRTSFMKQGVEDANEARMIAHDVDRNITSGERNTMDWHALDGVVPKSARFKGRQLMLADSTLEPFLSSNHSELTRAYLHSVVPEVNMVERFGDRDLSGEFQKIRDEYAHMIELAKGDSDKIRGLDKSRDRELGLLAAARDQLYGIYGVPRDPASFGIRAGRFLRALNVGRMLGGATFKHFPDAANVIQRYGAPQTMLVMAKLATSLDAIKMGYAEAKRMGAATDMVANISAGRLWDAPSRDTFPEQRVLNKFNRFFTIATLETPLITFTQSIASVAGQDEILRTAGQVAAGQMLQKNLAARLAAAGLDTGMLQRIADANARHGRQINGLKFGMSEQWADKEAARTFESAVIRDAHGVTMRPGIGDKPLFMSKEWGKFVFQFKSFEFAASRIVGLPMLQGLSHGDARAAQALLAQFAMATFGYVAYQKATGQAVEADPKKLIVELMDRTNLMGWTASAIFPALYGLGFKDLSRWYDKDPVSSIGPSAELVKEILDRKLIGRAQQALTGNLDSLGQQPLALRRSDEHFIRKMFPANQVWYARKTVDNLEDAIGDTFNLPGVSLAERKELREHSASSGTIQ